MLARDLNGEKPMAEEKLRQSPLNDKHRALEAKLADEGGWQMPLTYGSVMDECGEVRRRGGVFDLSHQGRIRVRGDGALDLLQRVCCGDVAHQEDETAAEMPLLNDRGGILDVALLLRLPEHWLVVTSAGNREKILAHLQAHAQGQPVKITDQTGKTAQLSVSGPGAAGILDRVLPEKVSSLPPLAVRQGSYAVATYTAVRTGWTGEWGLDVILPGMLAGKAWEYITASAGDQAMHPIGLAARDVLRIEAGRVRYGHEVNETIDPVTAGFAELVDWTSGRDFLGVEAVRKIRARGPARQRVGLVLTEDPSARVHSIARHGTPVVGEQGREVGVVTSGTYSPALQRSIAMAYVSQFAGEVGRELRVELPGQSLPARVVALPFV